MTDAATRPAAQAGWSELHVSAVWVVLAGMLALVMLVSLGIGRYAIPVDHVVGILANELVPMEPYWTDVESRVVLLIRLPRILVATLVGGGLALAGAALQGSLRNPLVGPQIVGVSSGAAFGGALAIFLVGGAALTVSLAFACGLAAIAIVYAISRIAGRTAILMLVLSGVVVSAFFGALTSLLTYLADPDDTLPAIIYWLMGSFASATYDKALIIALAALVAGVPLLLMRFRINVLSLGDEEAEALGVKVERSRWAVMTCVTGLTAGAVAISGIVGWIGLVVPHLARMLVGPDHRRLLPAAALIGATLMILVDNVARAATSAEIPLSVLTAILGAPLFGYLLRRTQARGWQT